MSFIRINPSNWAIGDSYTAAQLNASDVYWPSVLDKTGDNPASTPAGGITGLVSVNSGGEIHVLSGGSFVSASGSVVTIDSGTTTTINGIASIGSTGGIIVTSGGAIQTNLGSSLAIHGVSTISSGGSLVANSGSTLQVSAGATFTSAAIFGTSAGVNVTGGTVEIHSGATLQTDTGSTISMVVGSAGFIDSTGVGTFTANAPSNYALQPYARNVFDPFVFNSYLTNVVGGFEISDTFIGGVPRGKGTGAACSIALPLDNLHDGATLGSINLILAIGATGSVPSTKPTINVLRYTVDGTATVSGSFGNVSLCGGTHTITPSYASLNQQSISVSMVSNNVIDRSKYRYLAVITDDNSGNTGATGNLYFGYIMNYTSIDSLQFP